VAADVSGSARYQNRLRHSCLPFQGARQPNTPARSFPREDPPLERSSVLAQRDGPGEAVKFDQIVSADCESGIP
jgi:hypothetical protein